MGKGNRARIERAQNKLDKPQQIAEKKKAPNWASTAIVIFIVGILVLSLTLSALYDSGTLLRGSTAIETENYTVTGTMLSYFFNSQYSSFVQQYSSIISYLGLDTSLSLKAQECSMTDGGTWFDYFMDSTTAYVTELLNCCEYADANGIALDDEDEAAIDEAIEAMNEAAFENNYTLSGYITAMYGSGVKEKDLRKSMELVLLANKAAVDASDKFKAALTEDEIQKFFDENPSSFLKADYMVTEFDAELIELDKDDFDDTAAYDEAVAQNKETYETLKAEAHAKAEAYSSLNGFEGFLAKLQEDLAAKYDGYYDDDEDLTEEEREAKEKSAIATDLENATVEGHAYQDPLGEDTSEFNKWLFAADRKVGDIIVIEEDDEDAGTYTAYAYCVTATAAREEYKAADVAYALFSASEAASTSAADTLKAKLVSEGVASKEAFETLMKEQSAAYSGVLEDLTKGGFGYDEADEFIFADGRKAGDCEVVTCGTEYLAVIYYMAEGDDAWYVGATNGALNEKMEAWYEEIAETYAATVNEKALDKVGA